MRPLYVGDPHVRESDIEECRRLLEFTLAKAQEAKVDRIVILGDLHHNHSLLHVDVVTFWSYWLAKLAQHYPTIVLVGNHDQATTGSGNHSLGVHAIDGLTVVDRPTPTTDGILYLPFYKNNDQFVTDCKQFPHLNTLVCHQEFKGAQLNANFYSPNGVPLESIPQKLVISGHIHGMQELNSDIQKLVYVGSPRWMNLGDANIAKALAVYDHGTDGSMDLVALFDTQPVCRKIFQWNVTEKNAVDIVEIQRLMPHNHTFDIKGSRDYVMEQKLILERYGKVRTFIDRETSVKIKESDGILGAFKNYLNDFKPPNKTDRVTLERMAAERLANV